MAEFTIFNSMSGKKEVFTPIDPSNIKMYSCGPTVYDYAHIGNMRAAVVSDLAYRIISDFYGDENVSYARNITDIDDKIISAAERLNVDISDISDKFTKAYESDLRSLNCLEPNITPKVTDHVQDMISMISKLIKSGNAYESEGNVFFDTSSFDKYGYFHSHSAEKTDRVSDDLSMLKKSDSDFTLWKPSTKVGWNSPFGFGRMGWHIECSAMIKSSLGDTIDLHLGGIDLKFPHHENEIAQSECANNVSLSKYWMHNEFVNIDGDKMAKSEGNAFIAKDVISKWGGETVRMAILSTHYRKSIDWSEKLLSDSQDTLKRFYKSIISNNTPAKLNEDIDEFMEALLDDMNVPQAMSVIHKYHKDGLIDKLASSLNFLGLLHENLEGWISKLSNPNSTDPLEIDRLVSIRSDLRRDKKWEESDVIRDKLLDMGVSLEDKGSETIWSFL